MNEPAEGPAPIRWGARRRGRRRRWRPWRMTPFAIGVLVVLLSVTTCSSGMEVAALAEEYGPPVPATREAALGFVTRTSAAFREAPTTRRLSFQVTESEATSALSLGLMIPELMLAMQSMTQDEVQAFNDLAELRDHLHIRATRGGAGAAPSSAPLSGAPLSGVPLSGVPMEGYRSAFSERARSVLDPRLRSGDVQVRFTPAGEVVVAGYVQAWRWKQPALVVFAPRARSGELELEFRRGQLGRLPAPRWAFNGLGRLAASLVLKGREYAEISQLTVEDGTLSFTGVLHR